MFDVGFLEMVVIAVVALLVLGPERLPAAARTVGNFVRKARQSWQGVRNEFEREIAADEFKRSIRKTRDEFRSAFDPLADIAAPPSPVAARAPGDAATTTLAEDDAPPEIPPRGAAHPPHD